MSQDPKQPSRFNPPALPVVPPNNPLPNTIRSLEDAQRAQDLAGRRTPSFVTPSPSPPAPTPKGPEKALEDGVTAASLNLSDPRKEGGYTPRPTVLPVEQFAGAFRGWLEELKAELPAPHQQSAVSYLEDNLERLSESLRAKVIGGQNAR